MAPFYCIRIRLKTRTTKEDHLCALLEVFQCNHRLRAVIIFPIRAHPNRKGIQDNAETMGCVVLKKKEKGLSAWQITMLALGTVIGGSFFLGC